MKLTDLNQNSLSKILLCDNNFHDNDIKDTHSIIFARNGIFQVFNNEIFKFTEQINIPYSNLLLNDFSYNKLLYKIKKPDISIYQNILYYFRKYSNIELLILIYYNKETNSYELVIPKQTVNQCSIKYEFNNEYLNTSKYIKYLEIHSHGTMPAFFSSIDNDDEKCTGHFYGVIGNIDQVIITQKFRFYKGNNTFENLKLNHIFDIE